MEEKKNDATEKNDTADVEIIECMDVDNPTPSTSDNTIKDKVTDSAKTPTVNKSVAKTPAVVKTPLTKVESVAKTPTVVKTPVAKVMTPVNNTPANVRYKFCIL